MSDETKTTNQPDLLLCLSRAVVELLGNTFDDDDMKALRLEIGYRAAELTNTTGPRISRVWELAVERCGYARPGCPYNSCCPGMPRCLDEAWQIVTKEFATNVR